MSVRYAVVDLETTGPKFNHGERIIQVGAAFVQDGRIVDTYDSLVQPLIPIPPHIAALTGIHAKDVKDAPLFKEIAQELWDKLEGCVFVAHNVNFDYKFLDQAFQDAGFPKLQLEAMDTVELIRTFYPTADSYHLKDFCESHGIDLEHAHTASADAYATAELLLMVRKHVQSLPSSLMKQLHPYLGFLLRETGKYVEQWYAERDPDAELASETIGALTFPPKKQYTIKNYRRRDDRAVHLTWRPIQHAMDKALQEFFAGEERIGFLSAYAGAGKSLAAIKAARDAQTEGPSVFVTATNVLVDQLHTVTIPKYRELTGETLHDAVLVGKQRFIDLDGFRALHRQQKGSVSHVSRQDALVTMGIFCWLFETETGRIDELNNHFKSPAFWRKVQAYADDPAQPHIEWQGHDFYQNQWDAVADADILFTNHAFFARHRDTFQQRGLLGKGRVVIIDECHSMPATLIEDASVSLSLSQIGSLLNRTDRALRALEEAFRHRTDTETVSLDSFYEAGFALEHLFHAYGELNDVMESPAKDSERFLPKDAFEATPWHTAFCELWVYGRNFRKALAALLAQLPEYNQRPNHRTLRWVELLNAWRSLEQRLEALVLLDDDAYLLLSDGRRRLLTKRVYDGGALMQSVETAVEGRILFISQALPIYQEFKQLERTFGVTDYWYQAFPAPATYGQSTAGAYLKNEPSIAQESQRDAAERIAQHIETIMKAAPKSKLHVFFHSKALLQQTTEQITQTKRRAFFPLYVQRPAIKKETLRQRFEAATQGVLLSLDSFQEGMHLEHPADIYLLTRLPFAAPDAGAEQAAAYWLKQQGERYFEAYALPLMLVRLTQWLGRVFSTGERHNRLLILDRRFFESRYQRAIARILPPGFHWEAITDETDWLSGKESD